MLVFRDGGRKVALRPLLEQLVSGCRGVSAGGNAEARLAALLRAGELECALADAGSAAAGTLAGATDALAGSLLRRAFEAEMVQRLESLLAQGVPEHARISAPEGFAYY